MSRLGEEDRRHWHDDKGRHRMPDPRTFAGYPERFWDADERAFVRHLEAHEAEDAVPRPRHDDPPEITALFERISAAEQTIEASRRLIRAKRQQALEALQALD